MSSGRVHDKMSIQLSIPTSVTLALVVYFIANWQGSLLAFIFCFLGCRFQRYLSPDSDVDDGFYGDYLARKHFSKLIGTLFQWYMKPYAKIAHHRGVVSHTPILGTLIRFIYVMPLVAPLWGIMAYNWDAVAYFLFGMIILDCGHILLDYHLTTRYLYERLIDLH